jgi:hypothetical protein
MDQDRGSLRQLFSRGVSARALSPFALAALGFAALAGVSSLALASAASGVGAAVAWSLRGRLAAGGLRPLPVGLLAAAMVVIQAWLVTQGSFAFDVREGLGSAYDSLAQNLRRGSAEVDRDAIGPEAWRLGGRTFMYFGPWPALLRGAGNALIAGREGLWSRLSVLTAVTLALWAAAAMTVDALARNRSLTTAQRGALALTTLVALALGSPLLVIGSLAFLYHEAIAWGLCGALWGLCCAQRVLEGDERSLGWTAGLATAAGVALLSRLTFGGPLYAILGLLAARRLWHRRAEGGALLREALKLVLVMAPALAAIALQGWYNHARFGSALSFAEWSAYWGGGRPGYQSPVDLRRLLSGVVAYFGISRENFSPQAPYLVFRTVHFAIPALPQMPSVHRAIVISPLLTAPWALLGLAALRRARTRDPWRMACLLCLAGQAVLICSYYWVGYRYVAEFLPLTLALHAAWLVSLGSAGVSPRRSAWALAAVTGLAVIGSALSSLDLHRRGPGYPPEHRARINELLERADRVLGTTPDSQDRPRKRSSRRAR